MNKALFTFIIFFEVTWLKTKTLAQIARCDYKYDSLLSTNAFYYKCDLDTKQVNYLENPLKIDGQHLIGYTDTDVKFIANNKNNKLTSFSSIFCQKFPNLEIINIENAGLESIDTDSLSNCQYLAHLSFDGNNIHVIPEYLLYRNSKLTLFGIENNQLTTLPENFFLYKVESKNLDMHNNQINFLPKNIFRPLWKLLVLQLNSNKLQSIDPEWFMTLQRLNYLSLDVNQISVIPSKCFARLVNLNSLFLHENRIQALNSDSFDGLRNLKMLRLSNNEISELPAGVFTQLVNLKELDLGNNLLTAIHSHSFGFHSQLADVNLYNNKIVVIDPKFIDNTAISTLNTTYNICSGTLEERVSIFFYELLTQSTTDIKLKLSDCFKNYTSMFEQKTSDFTQINQHNICGNSKIGHGNIIGGTYIKSGDFPWIAALVTPAGKFFCGGTVVSSHKIVTAAHCIQEKKSLEHLLSGDVVVLLGMHDLNNILDIGRTSNAVYSINVHPDWNTLTQAYDADIAVLVLEKEVTFNEHVLPICLPASNNNLESILYGTVVGYGKSEDETKLHENIPKILTTPIHNNQDCFKDNEGLALLSSGRTFCGGSGRGVGVCNGDSGSGLIVSDGSAYYLRGVVSSSLLNSRRGCDVDTYAVFTDVLKYVDWINGISADRFAVRRKK